MKFIARERDSEIDIGVIFMVVDTGDEYFIKTCLNFATALEEVELLNCEILEEKEQAE